MNIKYSTLIMILLIILLKSLPLKAETADEWYSKGNKAYELGDPVKSTQYYLKAIEINPKHILARYSLAINYQEVGKNEKAIEQFLEILKIDPTYGEVYYDMGISYYNMKDRDKAIECFSSYLNYNTSGDEWAQKARAYIKELEAFIVPIK